MTKIIRTIASMKKFSAAQKRRGKKIGFVPTMGYLHAGHISLIKQAVKECDVVVASIFVNPTQFGPKEDLKKYPRDFKRDAKMLKKAGVDAIFYPDPKAMYPKGYKTYIYVRELGDVMCGKTRPGHFEGVATVVAKLFNIVMPDAAYFGKKDFQQQIIIKKMVADLNMDVKIVSLPTVREADGLAMSSRNTYLEPDERSNAAIINRSLLAAKKLIGSGVSDASKIKKAIAKLIATKRGIKIDYITIRDAKTFDEAAKIKGKVFIAIAAYVGRTRLIDNIEI
jgi:pantoate--beta-alanine ligase